MGVDFLDLTLRIEQRFGVRYDHALWQDVARGRRKFDVTAGEVCDLVERGLEARRARLSGDPQPPLGGGGWAAPVLSYEPARERHVVFEGDVWPAVQEVIGATLSVPATRIGRETWLVRDLGMT